MGQTDPLFQTIQEWDWAQLGDVCAKAGGSIQTGPFGSQLHASDYSTHGTPVVMPQDIGDNRLDPAEIARVGSDHVARLARHCLSPGDIVYSRRGDVRRRALVRAENDGWLCGTGCLRVRVGKGILDAGYASYYLGHSRVGDWIEGHAVGATMPNLNTSILSAVPIVLPSLNQQRAIAHILGTLDDKIELNRRMNRTLEELARALFTSWFVAFDPVRAKAAGRQPAGMDAATAALFPSGFEGEAEDTVPKGWQREPLSDVAQFLNGLALQKFPPNGGATLPVIKIAQLRAGSTRGADLASDKVPAQYVIEDGDVLFSWSGSLEVTIWAAGKGALNQHLFKVTSKQVPKWFYYFAILEHLPWFRSIAADKATTMGHIQRRHLNQATIAVPDEQVLDAAARVIAPLVERMETSAQESRTLATQRDVLLPKLLSGEISIADANALLPSRADEG